MTLEIGTPSSSLVVTGIGGPKGTQGTPGQSAIQRIASSAMSAGQVVRTDTTAQKMVPATSDLRTRPFDAILLGDIQSGASANFHVSGPIPANVLQLGFGVACAVGVDASGTPVRATDPTCVSAPNWVGHCDPSGNVTWKPIRRNALYVDDFGAVGDGSTLNDAALEAVRTALMSSPHNVVQFGEGVYRFAQQLGNAGFEDGFPLGTIFQGMGPPDRFRPENVPGYPLSEKTGTVLEFVGAGVGLHIGHADGNYGNYGAVRDLCIRGALTTGASEHPNINEVGLQILQDTCITVERVQITGFKYGISLDGAEIIFIRDISFEGDHVGYQDMFTDLGDDSACAIRIGSWICPVPDAANGLYIQGVQFNNSFYGIWHRDGVGCEVRNCNFELPGAWALLHGGDQILYANCLAEGQTIAGFHGRCASSPSNVFGLCIQNCFFNGNTPAIRLVNVSVAQLSFFGNEVSGQDNIEPIVGGNLVTGPVLVGANHLPGFGPGTGKLADLNYAMAGARGLAVNHWLETEASIDVMVHDFSMPMSKFRSGDRVYSESVQNDLVGGRQNHFTQVYNGSTGLVGQRDARTVEGHYFLEGSEVVNVGDTPSPGRGSGQVWITVEATRPDDVTKMASWRIRQKYSDATGSNLTLRGSPATEYAEDLDGSYVAPIIEVIAGSVTARLQAHPAKPTHWAVRVELLHSGF